MLKKLSYAEYSSKAAALMSSYAFMTTCSGALKNTMTIGWGTVGIIWNKPIFVALVRESRFTKGLVDESGEFTITFPLNATKEIKDALNFCGTKSGRDFKEGKITAAGLSTKSGQILTTPVLAIAGLNLECKVVFKQLMKLSLDEINDNLHAECYDRTPPDYHTIYYGEIVAAYEIN